LAVPYLQYRKLSLPPAAVRFRFSPVPIVDVLVTSQSIRYQLVTHDVSGLRY
jgi:hypothetical protein